MLTKKRFTNIAVLMTTCIILLMVDRVLLALLGLPLWMADDKLHYKHRPNAIRSWNSYDDKPILINSHGHHDDEFPVEKPVHELRVLNLGDSITMGHGVTRDETYSNQLEQLLIADSTLDYQSVQVINAGVQGYSTFQELEVLRRSFIFHPDLITVGFCLNDVTEPFVVNRRFGGTGLDYHRVAQTANPILDYIYNETGYGRLAQEIRIRLGDVRKAKLKEAIDVRSMIQSRDSAQVQERWELVQNDLEALYQIAKQHDVPVILLIFPYTFQFNDVASRWPQQVLKAHAVAQDVDYIDFTDIFEKKLQREDGSINDYYLDEDHYTVHGHTVIAESIQEQMLGKIKRK